MSSFPVPDSPVTRTVAFTGSELDYPLQRLPDGVGLPHDARDLLEAIPLDECPAQKKDLPGIRRMGKDLLEVQGSCGLPGAFLPLPGDPEDGDIAG